MKSLIINYLSILFCVQVFFACTPDVKKHQNGHFELSTTMMVQIF